MDARELNRRATELTSGIVGSLTDEQLDVDSKCAGWTVRDVIDHMVGNNRNTLERLTGGRGVETGDVRRDFVETEKAIVELFESDDVLNRPYEMAGGEYTAGVGLSVHAMDIAVHAWDIGSAIGIEVRLDEEMADVAAKMVARFPEHLWGPGQIFETRYPVADDATPQERLLAITGRALAGV